MLASVINSPIAIEASIYVVHAFIQLRELALTHKELIQKLAALEKKYDGNFKIVFEALRQLMEPPVTRKREIGFKTQ
jgi:hypothetical protein